MDLQKGEYIVYRNAGVCQVMDIEEQSMDGENTILYYKIKPISDASSTYYIPVAKAAEKLRYPLKKEEILTLIDTMPESKDCGEFWSDNRRERKEMYMQTMKSDDHMAILRLITALYFRKRASEARGRRFSAMDETMMKTAETLMLQEFGFVLEMQEPELRRFIDDRVKSKK
ncbi:MAG: hypothetical protein IJY06_08395 [Oscillospiraceae bacterium]|nr:hypothetical protein [Oscillospiraceae bacterium]MBQ9111369.1 hypothetical protein [Oscillospiraceae bacterium]